MTCGGRDGCPLAGLYQRSRACDESDSATGGRRTTFARVRVRALVALPACAFGKESALSHLLQNLDIACEILDLVVHESTIFALGADAEEELVTNLLLFSRL